MIRTVLPSASRLLTTEKPPVNVPLTGTDTDACDSGSKAIVASSNGSAKIILMFCIPPTCFLGTFLTAPLLGAPPTSMNAIPGKQGETDYGNRLLTVWRTELNTLQRPR